MMFGLLRLGRCGALKEKRIVRHGLLAAAAIAAWLGSVVARPIQAAETSPAALDRILQSENEGRSLKTASQVDDLAFLRRVTVDLIGRIPAAAEIDDYLALPAAQAASAGDRPPAGR